MNKKYWIKTQRTCDSRDTLEDAKSFGQYLADLYEEPVIILREETSRQNTTGETTTQRSTTGKEENTRLSSIVAVLFPTEPGIVVKVSELVPQNR